MARGYSQHLKIDLINRRKYVQILKEHDAPPRTDPNTTRIQEIREEEKNPLIQSARNCIRIQTDDQYGQYIVASRNIEIGEILVVEKPYTWVVFDHLSMYCHECLKMCRNVIPCNKCILAVYCSNTCKKNAFRSYHRYECPIQQNILSFFYDVKELVFFALKMTLLVRNDNDANPDESIYRSDRYHEISKLDSRIDNYPKEKLFTLSFITAMVFQFAKQKTDLFSVRTYEDKFKEQFLFNLQIGTMHYREIELYRGKEEDDNPVYSNVIYPLSSLFKHSCNANALCYTLGSTLVVKSVSTIKEGEQCFISYG